MTEKDKNTLKRKSESLQITADRLLQKEALKSWGGYNTDKLREIQKHTDIICALIAEIKED